MTIKTKNTEQRLPKMNPKFTLGIGLIAGVALSIVAYILFAPSADMQTTSGNDNSQANEPLYWVAPMDPNFKRDKPGKSPMGMDLIPVFENEGANNSAGTVLIDPVNVQNLGVKTALVELSLPVATITAVGQVQYAQDDIEHIHSRIEGWIEKLYVRTQGDYIKKGEPLYSIYSPELVNAQEEFVIALAQQSKSQKNPVLLNAARARLRALAVPQSQIDSLEKTRKVSQTVTILAPNSGFIDALNIQQGFYVKPSITMMSIASLERVWVIADVFPSDVSMLYQGQKASITSHNIPGSTFDAKLDYIYPTLSKSTRTVQARFVLENTNKDQSKWLKPNMYTRVQLTFNGEDSPDNNSPAKNGLILSVPKQAVIRTGKSDRVVLALGDGKYKSIDVSLGRSFDEVFEVLGGLAVGDKVVTSAQFLLDSESSIESDFIRMTPAVNTENTEIEIDESAWTQATVNELDLKQRKVNLTHGPLDAFDMMGMTMDFTVASDIDMTNFVVDESVHVEIIREPTGMFQVKTLHLMDNTKDCADGAHQ